MIRFFIQPRGVSGSYPLEVPDGSEPDSSANVLLNGLDDSAQEKPGGVIRLSAEDYAHIRALRLRPSEQFIVCDGNGRDYVCCLAEKATTGAACAKIMESRPTCGEPDVACTVFLAYAKGDRLEYAVQKSVELGALNIVLFQSDRCIAVQGSSEKKIARMQKIALEAAKQCGRGRIPDVTAMESFEAAVDHASRADAPLFFYEREEKLSLKDALELHSALSTVSIMTGPEGGFEEHEADLARGRGMLTVTLGPRVLRCETAPVAALAAIMYHTGNM